MNCSLKKYIARKKAINIVYFISIQRWGNENCHPIYRLLSMLNLMVIVRALIDRY